MRSGPPGGTGVDGQGIGHVVPPSSRPAGGGGGGWERLGEVGEAGSAWGEGEYLLGAMRAGGTGVMLAELPNSASVRGVRKQIQIDLPPPRLPKKESLC